MVELTKDINAFISINAERYEDFCPVLMSKTALCHCQGKRSQHGWFDSLNKMGKNAHIG